jgi:hypothetical protein
LGVGIFASLRLTHLIPSARLEEDYLVSLAEGISLSAILLRSFRVPRAAVRSPSVKNRLADVARAALMNRRDRRFFLATKRGERTAYRMLELQSAESESSAA